VIVFSLRTVAARMGDSVFWYFVFSLVVFPLALLAACLVES
jgi:hypothetical protein